MLLATGVALLVVGPRGGIVFTLHKASFIVWVGLIGIHVLAHLEHALRRTGTDLRRGHKLGGGHARRLVLAATLVATLVVGIATIPTSRTWVTWMKTHEHNDRNRSAHVGATPARS
jgi:hypothetical protein